METNPISASQARKIQNYFFYGLLLLVLGVSFYLFLPFISTLVVAAMASVILFPIYSRIQVRLGNNGVSAFISIAILAAFILVPLFFLVSEVVQESRGLYDYITAHPEYLDIAGSKISALSARIFPGFSLDIGAYVGQFADWVATHLSSIFSGTLTTLFNVLIGVFALFYFLRDGRRFREGLIKLSPLPDTYDKEILHRMQKIIHGVVRGAFLMALIQGVFTGLGFYIFGIPHAVLWGSLAAIAALVPGFGTSLVTVPAVVYLFAVNDTPNAVGLAIWAAVAVGMIDNIVGPIITGRGTRIPPLFILFSVLGGIAIFGASGFLLGPIIIGLLMTLLDIYSQEISVRKEDVHSDSV